MGWDRVVVRRRFGAFLLLLAASLAGCAGSDSDVPQALRTPEHRVITPDLMVPLWADGPPGRPAVLPQEHIVDRSKRAELVDRAVHDVNNPNLSIFVPKKANGLAILIVPGGGYSWVVIDKEGYEGARYFSERGYKVYVLRHRLPHQGWAAGPDTPLQDAQRAIRLIRSRAATDHIDPAQIMVLGFSAGGHVAGSLAQRFDQQIGPPQDAIDNLSARPSLAVLMYPVVTMQAPFAHPKSVANLLGTSPSAQMKARYSLETAPHPNTPPTFLLHANDDTAVPIQNTLLLFDALGAAKIPVALHAFERGGHGFGMRGIKGTPLEIWPDLVLDWAKSNGFRGHSVLAAEQ